MIDEQSFASFATVNDSLATAENFAITNNPWDFEKYDPYIEKIRDIFVPSLEKRIHSCLETFVYRRDKGQLSDSRYIKRCLEMAAAWREPVDAFCTKWEDEGFLVNMLNQAIKCLIKDGLMDCFLNSIILNNRLNKVCRDMDTLGVEKDLLRLLNVWNYINERDYWIENDERTPMSMSRRSHDSIDCHSDLDVEIGSKLYDYRNVKSSKRSLKRRATYDSLEVQKNDNSSEYLDAKEQCMLKLDNWSNVESKNEELQFNDGRKKPRSIRHAFQCRTSTCPIYRMKNSQQGEWDGKILKLQLSEACSIISQCEKSNPLEITKLRLPCNYDYLISKIIKIDSTLSRSRLTVRRKKFQASIIMICHRVNEILEKMAKNEVRRCRLYCDIFPGYLNFRMIQRQSNGCKVCLLSDRVLINKMNAKSQSASRESSTDQLSRISEKKKSWQSGLTIWESARFDVADKTPRIPHPEEKVKLEIDPRAANALKQSVENLESTKSKVSKELNGNEIDDEMCRCDNSLDHELDHFEDETLNNQKPDHVKDLSTETEENNSKELTQKASPMPSNDNTLDDETCFCTALNDAPNHLDNGMENNHENDNAKYLEIETLKANSKQLTGKELLIHSVSRTFEDQACLCDGSLGNKHDHSMKNSLEELPRKESLINSIDDKFVDHVCPCNISFDDSSDILDHKAKNIEDSCSGCLGKSVESILNQNHQELNDSVIITNLQKMNEHKNIKTCNSQLENAPSKDREVFKSDLTSSECVMNAPSVNEHKNQDQAIACECPSDCTCINKIILNQEIPDCAVRPNQMQTNKSECLISESQKLKSNYKESQVNLKDSKNNSLKSEVSLKSDATVVILKSCKVTETKVPQCVNPDRESLRESSAQCKFSEIHKIKEKSCHQESPIISARFPKSKGQRINISIELCTESGSSMEKIVKNESKNIPTLKNDFERLKNTRYIEPNVSPSSRRVKCQSVDRGNSAKILNSPFDKNTSNVYSGDVEVYSPPRPLESRDYVPSMERPMYMRNPKVPVKPDIHSNDKFKGRPMTSGTRTFKDNETREFFDSMRNQRCCDEIFRGQIRLGENEELSRSRKSERCSIVNGQHRQAFSSSSVDRMRHLIKTKLRRILMERDKSTNTTKTTFANKKYRVSVPNEKNESSRFSGQRCRTIWESHSASDSTCISRSFVSENRSVIHEREIADRLYSATTGPNISSSDWRNVKNDRQNEVCQMGSMKNRSRLAGGSDIIPSDKKAIDEGGKEGSSDKMRMREEFRLSKNQRHESRAKKEIPRPTNLQSDKLSGKSVYCHFHEISENDSRLTSSNTEISRMKFDNEFIPPSEKLDSLINSTSRHIYLYEFAQFETSNDDLSKSRSDDRNIRLKNIKLSENQKVQVNKQNSRMNKKGRNSRDIQSQKSRYAKKQNNVLNSVKEPKNSSSNTNTNNYREKSFSYLDYDLRSKLAQYVNLCKNVKYSLLKRLRHDEAYEISKTSISCGDRCKFGHS